MLKAASGLHLKELVQVKGKFLRFAVDLHALPDLVPDNLGHLVGVEVEPGEGLRKRGSAAPVRPTSSSLAACSSA